MSAPRKLRPYAVRLEWASTISYVDVAVMARDLAHAVKVAGEDVNYDLQDNYDDGGETYVSAVAPFRTLEQAEEACNDRSVWDHYSGEGLPLREESGEQQAWALWRELAYMRAALARCQATLTEAAQHTTGDIQARAENDARLAAYLVKNAPR